MVTAVTGPGAITPDKDIKTASNKKADSNNFHSLAGLSRKNFKKNYNFFIILDLSIYCINFISLIDIRLKSRRNKIKSC
jgi:hypothetical protein